MNMGLRNCAECGNLFGYQGSPLCPKCIKKDEEDFVKVRKYLRENPGASVLEASEATEVEEEKILRYVREGRLQSKSWVGVLECERCGARISDGRLCEACRTEVNRDLQNARATAVQKTKIPEPDYKKPDAPKKKGERMFIRGREK